MKILDPNATRRYPLPSLALCLALVAAPWLAGCGPVSEADDGGLLSVFPSREHYVDLVVPAGTLLHLTLEDGLSSRDSSVGESFTAVLTQDVSVDGRVAVPEGSVLIGRVTAANQAEKIGGKAKLAVDFVTLQTGDESIPISASLVRVGKSERLKDGAIIAGATVAGVVLGESLDKGEGGVIGGILGGVGGAVAAKETGGKPIVIPPGTGLAVELDAPFTLVVPDEEQS